LEDLALKIFTRLEISIFFKYILTLAGSKYTLIFPWEKSFAKVLTILVEIMRKMYRFLGGRDFYLIIKQDVVFWSEQLLWKYLRRLWF